MRIKRSESVHSIVDRHRLMVPVICVALLVRVGLFAAHVPFPPLAKDDSVYDNLAWNMVSGHGFSNSLAAPYEPMAVRTPGYPAFVASVYEFAGRNPNAVRVVQIVLSIVTTLLVYLLALRLMRKSQAVAAAALYSVLPAAAYFPSLLLTEANQALLLTFVVYCTYRCLDAPTNVRWYVACAVALACAIMFRPDYQFLMIPLFGALILLASDRRAVAYRSIAAALLVVLLITPWMVRNYLVFDKYIGLASGSGHTAVVARLEAEGLTGARLDAALQQRYGQAFEARYGRPMTYLDGALPDQDELRRREFVDFVKSHPFRYLKQSVGRLVWLWTPRSWSEALGLHGDLSEAYSRRRWADFAARVLILMFDACVLGLAALGLVFGVFNLRRLAVFWLVIIYMCAIYGLVYANPRYRVPILPLVAILAVYAVSHLVGVISQTSFVRRKGSSQALRRESVAS